MSGGLPEAKPCASCWPRSEATTTLTWMPVRLLHALAALLTANVSAGPELPIRAVMVVALLDPGDAIAAPTATARAQTAATTSARRQRALLVSRTSCTSLLLLGDRERRTNGRRDGPSDPRRQLRRNGYFPPSAPAERREMQQRGTVSMRYFGGEPNRLRPKCSRIYRLTGTARASRLLVISWNRFQ